MQMRLRIFLSYEIESPIKLELKVVLVVAL